VKLSSTSLFSKLVALAFAEKVWQIDKFFRLDTSRHETISSAHRSPEAVSEAVKKSHVWRDFLTGR